jgi:hypothetical protein
MAGKFEIGEGGKTKSPTRLSRAWRWFVAASFSRVARDSRQTIVAKPTRASVRVWLPSF